VTAAQADQAAVGAISAGWAIFGLYDLAGAGPQPAGPIPLPVVGQLTGKDAADLAIDRLLAWIAGPLRHCLVPPHGLLHGLRRAWHEDRDEERRRLTGDLHLHLLTHLTVADGRYGAAYSLGLSLADTTAPAADLAELQARFTKNKVSQLQAWLGELDACLPAANTKAVAAGLDHWSAWLQVQEAASWAQSGGEIGRALANQGAHWHTLLTSDADPARLLSPEAYVEAGEQALHRAGHIALRVVSHFWWLLLVVAAAVAAVIAVAFAYTEGADRIWSTAASLLAGVGVSGASIRSTARNLATGEGHSLLEMEQNDAIGWATTWLPAVPTRRGKRRALRKAGVAAPQTDFAHSGEG
jgi:hypothetical protein